ncbi:putative bifunctional diguanylate cyclase/phosphodiesterase [Marinobacter nauticus]|uniref:cyclic-guanylate-specific phosphodiesterase n=1 Tax=Marinobacter nauticus (strain ATCC 700491 / DSM 11845 / VT8) TaxID=351348 RepID=A1U786_MARN8|nr:EAL domain-containing protein [Marinobacter nauticus]ABM20855.1 periplasmic sensor diguanylate cyclase/phosphodiesterase [Marinobacter nauticus VT8]
MAKPETSIRLVVRALMSPVFPVLIFLVFLGIASGLRVGLIQQNTHQIQTNLSNEARALANNLEREFMVHLDAIGRMAMRMQANPSQTEALWREDARNYLRDFGVYQAIEWIDRNYIIRWLEPLSGNSDVIGFNVAFNEQRRAALSRAAASGQYDISGIIDLRQGGEGLVIYHPVGRGDANNGFMAGVFRMNTLAEQMLTRRVLEQFQVTITQSDQTSYLLNTSSDLDNSLNHTVPINLPSLDWSLTLTPSRQWVEGQRSSWPTMTFTSLLLMGLLTSLTTLLVQLILKRNQALLKTRRELEQEIDQRKAIQVDLQRLESTDTLTGLANRRFFMEDLAHTINIADRQMRQIALVMMDLDRFQMLNDSLGHQFGDELLIKVSERLNGLSNERVLVAYSGGDEFMVCQQQVDDIDDVIHLLGQIKQCFAAPFEVQGEAHSITATMGVAVYPQSGLDADTLLRNADIALYRAKEQGRNTYQFYTEGMQDREVLRLELDRDLSQALANDEFVLYFQPQLNLDTGEINSVEALIRWQHPVRGLLPPVEFIPLAEESGRITEIGRWVVLAACRQLARWKGTPCEHLRVAVNLSGRELDDDSLIDHIRSTLASEAVDPSRLEVELTEEIFIQNIEHNLNQLSQLHQLGVHLAIDDFGVGYSSLGYLRDFPVDLLKIDRSFITDVTERHDDAVITRAVINLAHNLGIQVVAEGVETEEQLNFLKAHRCNLAQGYLISRPIPAADLERALAEGILIPGLPVDSGL